MAAPSHRVVGAGLGGQSLQELVAKMGEDMFQKSYDYLSQARSKNVDERTVQKELQALIGRENYKRFGFDVDQLVFTALQFS
mmetsp:Transcript_124179/g.243567  ORF Transcript_124179/g.243567 Transcript_124179/m.243567 type:complete len:82 (+) Transcript_124179:130-375(+)